jgi:uncharacterized membrane protein YhaH (DUF805 family)
MQWYLAVLKNYVGFSGRARRTEYWTFFLVSLIISSMLALISLVIGDENTILSSLYGLAVLVPTLAVTMRRLHDTGRPGWWLLVGLIPVVGVIVLLVFAALPGTAGTNEYGSDPKGPPVTAFA